jgi:hypothetical protein
LIAVTSKGVYIGDENVRFCQADRDSRFLHLTARFADLWMGCECLSYTGRAQAGCTSATKLYQLRVSHMYKGALVA